MLLATFHTGPNSGTSPYKLIAKRVEFADCTTMFVHSVAMCTMA